MQTLEMLKRDDEESAYIPDADEEISEDGRFVSEEEYWENYYIHPYSSYEWNSGFLEEKPMTDYKGWLMYHWFEQTLSHFLSVHPLAKTMGLDFGFSLSLPRRKKSVRKPDLSVIRSDNPILLHPDDQSYKGTLDMCIESLSYSRKSEILRDTVVKKREYQNVRVREYFILDARMLKTAFYRLDDKGKYREIAPENRDIIHSEVLPGFRFRISDLLKQPTLEEMAHDELYQDWILPFYQKSRQKAEAERLRAEKAEKKAERQRLKVEKAEKKAERERRKTEEAQKKAGQERCRAEQSEQKAARLAAKLRELGIDPELSDL
ncbi:MAG: Uma2 family endonuclease [Desulfococcaceae bacterium]